MNGKLRLILTLAAFSVIMTAAAAPTYAQMDIHLDSDLPNGQPVGTVITWTIRAAGEDACVYRLSAGLEGHPLRVVYDYSPTNELEWAPIDDGTYIIAATVRNLTTGERETVATSYRIEPLAGFGPVVTPTENSLVALYSAPPCEVGHRMRVLFKKTGAAFFSTTNLKECRAGGSMNFYVAGMVPNQRYRLIHEIVDENGSTVELGPNRSFKTGFAPLDINGRNVFDPGDLDSCLGQNAILWSPTQSDYLLASNLLGRVIWYTRGVDLNVLFRPVPGGTFLLMTPDPDTGLEAQLLREIDLLGRTVRETNALRISEQLNAKGLDPFLAFHHEARRLPNGHTAVLGSTERILEDVQGPGPIDVLGDYIVILDDNWQVVWAWNSFEHLDVYRQAVLGETCENGQLGCPPIFFADIANDWLHSNAIAYSPWDGNLLLSMRHQDWVIKIDYRDGSGTGDVLWRLGPEGDFTIDSADPYPWFTHQHDPNYVQENRIVIYDNGNTRCEQNHDLCYSRGQVYQLNESTMTAELVLNADLENYSFALGSAQPLPNGNFHFNSGTQFGEIGPFGSADEIRPDGSFSYSQALRGIGIYRSFRMRDMYTEPGQ